MSYLDPDARAIIDAHRDQDHDDDHDTDRAVVDRVLVGEYGIHGQR
ncbi:hypothetical protein [Gordonia sp. DT101]